MVYIRDSRAKFGRKPQRRGLMQIFRHKLEVKNGMNAKTCSGTEYGLS